MAAADPQAFFLTPPPRHLAELRIDTAPSAVAFSAPCGAAKGAGRKRRCLVPSSSVRKRMLLELAPFDVAPAPTSSSTPPPPWTPSPSPPLSPVGSFAGAASSPARDFSFDTELRVVPPASPGNIFALFKNPARNPGGCEARSGLSFLAPLGQGAKPADAAATAPQQPKTPTATGPTANGGFVFAAPPEGLPTPTSTTASSAPSFLASPNQPMTPMASTATGGFGASSEPPSLTSTGKGAVVPLISLKPARSDSNATGHFAFPTSGPACTQVGSAPSVPRTGSIPVAGIARPPFVITPSQLPPPLHNPGEDNHKRPSLFLRRAATCERRKSLRLLDEQQEFTLPPQKIGKRDSLASGEASRSSIISGSPARPCCKFFTPSKEAAKQEAQKAFSEASQSLAVSHCLSPARPATPEKAKNQEPEVEVSSSPSERAPDSPKDHSSTSPAVVCSGAEVVVRVTCKCGVHKEFCFDHRL